MKRVRSRLPTSRGGASSSSSSSSPWWRGQQGEEVRRMTYDLVWKALKKVIKADAAVQTIGEMVYLNSCLTTLGRELT